MTLQEHIAYIDRAQNEVRKFCAEQHALMAEEQKAALAPSQIALAALLMGAAIFTSGMMFARLAGM